VTFTAVVTAPGYSGTPTGKVIFTIDGQQEPAVPLAIVGGSDQATFTTSALAAGAPTGSAGYTGGTHRAASPRPPPAPPGKPATPKPTTVSLASSANPSTAGQAVTLTAVVSPGSSAGTPTGTVLFTIDGNDEPVALQVVGGSDEAVFTTSSLAAGTHTIGAS